MILDLRAQLAEMKKQVAILQEDKNTSRWGLAAIERDKLRTQIAEKDKEIEQLRESRANHTEAFRQIREERDSERKRAAALASDLIDCREKLKIPHPQRDFVNECNVLLTAKQREIERVTKLIRKDDARKAEIK